ncbi:MAG: hypothetical protein IPJ13_21145 [Saprospiraceae bacterium]|nr:hypothetical protein [Saprospiraceae bacterium]
MNGADLMAVKGEILKVQEVQDIPELLQVVTETTNNKRRLVLCRKEHFGIFPQGVNAPVNTVTMSKL